MCQCEGGIECRSGSLFLITRQASWCQTVILGRFFYPTLTLLFYPYGNRPSPVLSESMLMHYAVVVFTEIWYARENSATIIVASILFVFLKHFLNINLQSLSFLISNVMTPSGYVFWLLFHIVLAIFVGQLRTHLELLDCFQFKPLVPEKMF